MKRAITTVAGAIVLALGASLATAQSVDEDGCWDANDCVTGVAVWEGDDFYSIYKNVCDRRVLLSMCNETPGSQRGPFPDAQCGMVALLPGSTMAWPASDAHNPTGQYAWTYIGSANSSEALGNGVERAESLSDWACAEKWGLAEWEPGW